MNLRNNHPLLLAGLVAALAVAPGLVSAQDCLVHGEAVGSSMLMDAIDAARIEAGEDGGGSAAASEDKGPHEADKDDGKWDVTGTFGPVKTIAFTTDEGTWMNLDVHPDGERIVFDMLGDLYVVPMEGGEAQRISDGAAYDFQPQFSPDGKQLLFTSDRGGGFNIWVADFADGELGESQAHS